MIEGPGPPLTVRRTNGPIGVAPTSFWAMICRSEPGVDGRRDTHRILLLWCFEGGETSGSAHRIAAICPCRLSTYGIRGFALLNPARAHAGSGRGDTYA